MMSSRAATEGRLRPSVVSRPGLRVITGVDPYLPPQQGADYQVEFGGKIRLACGRGRRVGADNKQATSRQRVKITAGQVSQASAYFISLNGAAHRTAYHEPYPGRLVPGSGADDQMPAEQAPPGPAALADGRGELRLLPHP